MLKQTILEVLNAEAQRLGTQPITDRILEDWIYEDLFSGPTEKGLGGGGSEWRYSPTALKVALEVVRLKASGARRYTALRLRLWLLDFDVPVDRIAEDLRSEFDRLLRRRFFAIRCATTRTRTKSVPSARSKRNCEGGSNRPGLGRYGAPAAVRRHAKPRVRIGLGPRRAVAPLKIARRVHLAIRL